MSSFSSWGQMRRNCTRSSRNTHQRSTNALLRSSEEKIYRQTPKMSSLLLLRWSYKWIQRLDIPYGQCRTTIPSGRITRSLSLLLPARKERKEQPLALLGRPTQIWLKSSVTARRFKVRKDFPQLSSKVSLPLGCKIISWKTKKPYLQLLSSTVKDSMTFKQGISSSFKCKDCLRQWK